MKWRLFLTCWVVFSLHFATNVVREHYPAFTLVERGSLQLDEYAGFHADIFQHTDGHHYVGNQVAASFVAAVPLLVFDPVLDWLEDARKGPGGVVKAPTGNYDTEYLHSAQFFQLVRDRGLDLRFGGATVVTSVFLMAPLCAAFVVLMFLLLMQRGVPRGRALWLAILFAFATPVFYRSATLNHNVFVMIAVFCGFLVLWRNGRDPAPLSFTRRFVAGLLAGAALAFDYVGVVTLPALFVYLLLLESRRGGLQGALRSAPAFILGTLPPVLFLLATQWSMYGNPFLPGQFWMTNQNLYVNAGARGMTLPDPELFAFNLFHPSWGLFAFAPLLLIGWVPARRYAPDRLLLGRRDRRWMTGFVLLFLVFCSANQYSRLQWNTGFRYLLPLVPFVFLQAADHLSRLPRRWLIGLSIPVILHGWVLSMVRYTPPFAGDAPAVPESWHRFLTEGIQFPWLTVVRQTPSLRWPVLHWDGLPYCIALAMALTIAAIWKFRRGTARVTEA